MTAHVSPHRQFLHRLSGAFPWLPGLEVGPGWAAVLWEMSEDVEDLIGRSDLLRGRQFRIRRVKSKDGSLSISVSGVLVSEQVQRRVEAVIERTVARAAGTCERCGESGALGQHAGRWSTLCIRHHAEAEARLRPGDEA